jgi:hypothetical protein
MDSLQHASKRLKGNESIISSIRNTAYDFNNNVFFILKDYCNKDGILENAFMSSNIAMYSFILAERLNIISISKPQKVFKGDNLIYFYDLIVKDAKIFICESGESFKFLTILDNDLNIVSKKSLDIDFFLLASNESSLITNYLYDDDCQLFYGYDLKLNKKDIQIDLTLNTVSHFKSRLNIDEVIFLDNCILWIDGDFLNKTLLPSGPNIKVEVLKI